LLMGSQDWLRLAFFHLGLSYNINYIKTLTVFFFWIWVIRYQIHFLGLISKFGELISKIMHGGAYWYDNADKFLPWPKPRITVIAPRDHNLGWRTLGSERSPVRIDLTWHDVRMHV
jgi:hypothetical protein